jgi:hypothetical protein
LEAIGPWSGKRDARSVAKDVKDDLTEMSEEPTFHRVIYPRDGAERGNFFRGPQHDNISGNHPNGGP